MIPLLSRLVAFAVTLSALLVVSRWITRQVQVIGLRLTGDERLTMMAYYLLLLPGILLHELSHFLTARVLGLKVGKFALGPRRRGKYVELGSVTVSSGGALRDSLVGLAPFLTGTVVLLLVGYRVFNVTILSEAWQLGGWGAFRSALRDIWQVPDFWLWAYLIFVVSNAMAPSESDRKSWLLAGVYVAVALAGAYLLGAMQILPDGLGDRTASVLQLLTVAFLFTLLLDLVAGVSLWLIEMLIVEIQRTRR